MSVSDKVGGSGAPKPLALPPVPGPTVLPSPIASVVSLVSRSSTISLRLYSLVGETTLNYARLGTITGIEIGRTLLEEVLLRAGRDVRHSKGETLTGKSIDLLHSSLSLTQLLLSTTFHLSSFTLTSLTSLCQSTIQTVDSIFGDTESSRAIAAIMQILKREFGDDGTQREVVSVSEVIGGLTWFAVVQMRCRRRERETLKWKPGRKPERVLWDVIVLDGAAPTVKTNGPEPEAAGEEEEACSSGSERNSELDDLLGSDDESDGENSGRKLKSILFSRLPSSASISVTTSSTTTKTTTIEVTGTSPPDFTPPKNAVVLSEASHHSGDASTSSLVAGDSQDGDAPRYKIVYQTVSRKEKKRKMKRKEDAEDSIMVEEITEELLPKDAGRPNTHAEEERMKGVKEWREKLNLPQETDGIFEPDVQVNARAEFSYTQDRSQHTLSPPRKSSGGLEDIQAPSQRSSTATNVDDAVNRQLNVPNSKKTLAPASKVKAAQKTATIGGTLTKPKKEKVDRGAEGGVENNKEKVKHPKTLRKAWNSSSFLPVPSVISSPKDKKKASSGPSARDHPSHSRGSTSSVQPSGLKTPAGSRETTLTTSRSRSELVGVERSSSRASNHGIEKDSVVSTRSQTSMTTRTGSGSLRGHYSMTTTHTQAQDASYPYSSNPYMSPTFSAGTTATRQGFAMQSPQTQQLLPDTPSHGIITEPPSPLMPYRDSRSDNAAPSIYTLRTSHSQTSLYRDFTNASTAATRDYITRAGGMYPPSHPIANIAKFIRYSSAAYGQDFLRLLGIGDLHQRQRFASTDTHHAEHHAFSYHTKTSVDTILLSSFTDGAIPSGEGMVPLVHFVCLDHDMKAVVVTCRGTLGLEDVLADLTCEYDDITIKGKIYRVHKGMFNSCMALLHRSNLLRTLRIALQEFQDYGLVFCGHSLGGGVASLLSIFLSEPSTSGFVTSNANMEQPSSRYTGELVPIPTGRPVHCYSYGSPACVDAPLRTHTRRLITSVVHGADVVPSLSYGTLKDFQSVALAFKEDKSNVIEEIRRRVLVNLARRRAWIDEGDDDFLWVVLKTLRACMRAEKLVPPGEVIVVATEHVLTKEGTSGVASGDPASDQGGMRQATKVTAKLVQDVEARFGEVKFSKGMFGDHNPRNYEACLELLARGVCGED